MLCYITQVSNFVLKLCLFNNYIQYMWPLVSSWRMKYFYVSESQILREILFFTWGPGKPSNPGCPSLPTRPAMPFGPGIPGNPGFPCRGTFKLHQWKTKISKTHKKKITTTLPPRWNVWLVLLIPLKINTQLWLFVHCFAFGSPHGPMPSCGGGPNQSWDIGEKRMCRHVAWGK